MLSINLPFTWTASTDAQSSVTGYNIRLYSNSSCTTEVATKSVGAVLTATFTSADGVANNTTYYAKVRAQNGASFYGDYSACSNGVTVNNTTVTAPAFTLYDNDTTNTVYSNSLSLRATITGSCDGITKVLLSESETGITSTDIENNGVACSTSDFALSKGVVGEGNKTLYLWAKNVANSISAAPSNDSITIDTTAPSTPGTPTDAGVYSNSTNLTFTWTASTDGESGVLNYTVRIYSDVACSTAVSTIKNPTTNSYTFTASDGVANAGTYYAKVLASNNAGSDTVYSACSDGVIVDTTAPTGTITLGGGANYWTSDTSPTIALTQAGSATEYRLCIDTLCNSVVRNWSAYAASPAVYNFGSQGAKTLYLQLKDAAGNLSSVYNDSITIDMDAPGAPTGLSLVDPASSPSDDDTPTIRVTGLEIGATLRIYKNSTCTDFWESKVAGGTTDDITLSALLTTGAYTFYADQTDPAGNKSACSSASLSYQLTGCPAGYVKVAANASIGTPLFCVMKYEAKNVSGVATSQATGTPWVSITATAAYTACANLGAGYHLISNAEWMAIARDAENVASNWSGGAVGTGMIPRGHSDSSPNNALAITSTADPYSDTGNTSAQAAGSGWEQKRTLTLSNGSVVWDIAGNVAEWVDWSTSDAAYTVFDTENVSGDGWIEYSSDTSCIGVAMTQYKPSPVYTSSQGMGKLYEYNNVTSAPCRGGGWNIGTNAGAFTLLLHYSVSISYTYIGFRCSLTP